jgi:predicted transcriptional regulator
MTSPASPAPKSKSSSNAKPPGGSAGLRAFQGKLTAARLEELREWVEGSNLSYKRIGEAMGVSPATISRYVAQEGWQRPPGAPLPSRMGLQRERVREKLWRLTERHAEALEDQPIDVAQRSLQPLARLTRILGDMERHAPPPRPVLDPDPPPASPDPRDGRTIHELRDELVAHLERITAEEGYGWEERSWWFEHGGGI